MAKLYKLTNTDKTTMNGMKWGYRKVNELPVKTNPRLCSPDVIHAYESLEVAAFLRFSHGYDSDVLCFESEGDIVVRDATKCGVFKLRTGEQVKLPQPTLKQTVLFALLCAKAAHDSKHIDEAIAAAKAGDFKTADAAWAAARAAAGAADAAWAAARAADAAGAADAAADAADAAADAAWAAARAADAAAWSAAAYAAANAAASAAASAAIDLKAIAIEALSHA